MPLLGPMPRHIHIAALASPQIRTASFDGREHMVVPVVALVEGVIHASNSDNPEFVPGEVLGAMPAGWNGEPVLSDHPVIRGQRVSANDPQVLDAMAFGRIFNTKFTGTQLEMEAWLDPERAEELGGDAQNVIERLRNNETVEVSVGAFVRTEPRGGTFEGKQYSATWREVVPDHLAMLPVGTKGACNIEMGCGALRAAECFSAAPKERPTKTHTRLAAEFRGGVAPEKMSDIDLRNALQRALEVDDSFFWIEAIYPQDSAVVCVFAYEGRLQTYRQTYTLDSEGKASLNDDRQVVQQVVTFEPVSAAAGRGSGGSRRTSSPTEGGPIVACKKERAKALVALASTPWTEDDTAYLESLSDERLTALETHAKEATPPPTPAPVPAPQPTPQAPPTTLSEEDWLKQAPPSVRSLVERAAAAEQKQKDTLIAALSEKQDVYTKEELEAKSVSELEKLSRVAAAAKPAEPAPDFSGRGPARPSGGADDAPPPPIDLAERIRKLRGREQTA